MKQYSTLRKPILGTPKSFEDVTIDIATQLERRPAKLWWAALACAVCALGVGATAVAYQLKMGIGTWGLNNSVGWAFDITNFVFWVGIGHAGTFISAILFLLRQPWRTSINRSAEAMTLIAVACAGIFPLIHMGRPWLFFWATPYPNSRGPLWVNFRSPLVWDCIAIGTYFTISLVFWYLGLIPDLATLRDRATSKTRRFVYGILSFGWNGSMRVWHRYDAVYLLLAALATPLVLSVHTIVSMDFATSIIPGWHSTVFPPYFVAGAIFSGFAMVLTLLIVARKIMSFQDYITIDHIDKMCRVMLAAGSLVGISYAIEVFVAWYSVNPYERFAFLNRALGPYAWAYWTMITCNVFVPQLLWFRNLRRNVILVFVVSILINVGMWMERFVIIVTSLHRDFMPSSWSMYKPTIIEIAILLGAFGLFFTAFLLFARFLPFIAISEVKGVLGYARRPQERSSHKVPVHAISEAPAP
ncbi:MAG: polysulfide reductase NrfD [Planctomycetes bacterium]|nr:polysulfide reductase NrfD [Planctomycetota bacterium]